MNDRQTRSRSGPATPEQQHFDVIIVGAGISGVGGAYHLKTQTPDKRFIVLENQASFGGTWITHRYPGIRSDSDLYTFGYRFKPWTGAPIATSEEILNYMGEVIAENDLDQHIRYGQQVTDAQWSSSSRRWTLTVTDKASGRQWTVTAGFLWMCQGYYNHRHGYTPTWPGMEKFQGQIVHPQQWPDDLDYQDRSVVVIGSGATAATLVPAMAGKASHVTMLQRSPTYFSTGRNANALADTLRELEIDETWIHEIVRKKILFDQARIVERSTAEPEALKSELLQGARKYLGPDFDLDTHFTPSYRPWHQRIAFVPDGDMFAAIAKGQASVVTDEIETFTATGVQLKSGQALSADIIVTATGFDLNVMGDIAFTVDDRPVDFSDTVTWRGAMFTGVPNMIWVFGYFRASWTLRVDLIADLVCRLLKHMDANDVRQVVPALRADETTMPRHPWVEPDNFNPGYLMRSLNLMPRQGDREPWLHTQDYWRDRDELPVAPLDDGALRFE